MCFQTPKKYRSGMRFSVGVRHPRRNNLPDHTKTGFVCPHLDSTHSSLISHQRNSPLLGSPLSTPAKKRGLSICDIGHRSNVDFPHSFAWIFHSFWLPPHSLALSAGLAHSFYCLALFLCHGMCEYFCVFGIRVCLMPSGA